MPDEIEILETLKQVNDPELMVNIVDLGLIYNVSVSDKSIEIEMTLTSPACPAGPQIINQSKAVLSELENVEEVIIEQGFQQSGCTTTECAVEIGQLLGTDKLLLGSVGRIGRIYTINAKMPSLGLNFH